MKKNSKTILISLDIDGTLEIGDPPGDLTMDQVRIAKGKGYIIGTCSDRPISTQRNIFKEHNIEIEFSVSKHMLPDIKKQFEADVYCHIGDRDDLDRQYAIKADYDFMWPDEAAAHEWFKK
jgi:hypothetical protein